MSFAIRFGAGFGTVAAALLGLPVSAALLPEVFLTILFYRTRFYVRQYLWAFCCVLGKVLG